MTIYTHARVAEGCVYMEPIPAAAAIARDQDLHAIP